MSEQFFDQWGTITGYMESDGSIFDKFGNQLGYVRDGKLYDRWSTPVGRIDSDGTVYDQWETPKGKIDTRGNCFDQYGNLRGNTQSSDGSPGSTFW